MVVLKWPVGTTWQDVRDWLRPTCEVDHVEMFPDRTSGWVRVKGEDHFHKALCKTHKPFLQRTNAHIGRRPSR